MIAVAAESAAITAAWASSPGRSAPRTGVLANVIS
jgi:hypothetical protein